MLILLPRNITLPQKLSWPKILVFSYWNCPTKVRECYGRYALIFDSLVTSTFRDEIDAKLRRTLKVATPL